MCVCIHTSNHPRKHSLAHTPYNFNFLKLEFKKAEDKSLLYTYFIILNIPTLLYLHKKRFIFCLMVGKTEGGAQNIKYENIFKFSDLFYFY